jgi:hypothetical protein
VTDPSTSPLPRPEDPWAGRAAVPGPQAPPTGLMPQVILVEVPRKRRWPWALGIFALLGVVCCGICAAVTGPIWKEYPSRIALIPERVGELQRDDSDLMRLVALAAADRIRIEQGVDDGFAGAFLDPKSKERNAYAFGGTLLVWDPADALRKAIQGAGSTITQVTTFDAGRMGGQLKCANGQDDKHKPIVICAWVDHGSVGIGVFYGGRSMPDCAAFMRALREAIIIRP